MHGHVQLSQVHSPPAQQSQPSGQVQVQSSQAAQPSQQAQEEATEVMVVAGAEKLATTKATEAIRFHIV